jgi:hypothetical protein
VGVRDFFAHSRSPPQSKKERESMKKLSAKKAKAPSRKKKREFVLFFSPCDVPHWKSGS